MCRTLHYVSCTNLINACRCDGQYKLVIDRQVKSMMNAQESAHSTLCGYLVGLNGDQIAYCTQASEGISLQCQDSTQYRAEILRVNNRRTDNKLYICIAKSTNIRRDMEMTVSAAFSLKFSYFERLRSSIAHLSKNGNILNRLQPGDEDFQLYPVTTAISQSRSALHLDLCSDDQLEALTAAVSSPASGAPFLISGPFGSGKTRILALVSRFLFYHHSDPGYTRILVCTQQHVSADTFLECYKDLAEEIDTSLQVVRIVPEHFYGRPNINYTTLRDFKFIRNNVQRRNKSLIITTCSTAYSMFEHSHLHSGFFTHILIDEAAQMREPEAVGPLCFAAVDTKIILAGDQHQVC